MRYIAESNTSIMKYILKFENYTAAPIPKAVSIQQEMTLMDKSVDKEITEEEKEELLKDEEELKKKEKLFKKKKAA